MEKHKNAEKLIDAEISLIAPVVTIMVLHIYN